MESIAKFAELMTKLFQMEEAKALDFGIYRVIRAHNREVRGFVGEVVTSPSGEISLRGGKLGELLDSAFASADNEELARLDKKISDCLAGFGIGRHIPMQEAERKLME